MLNIYSGGEKITYSTGDTFELSVSNAEEFEKGAQLRFVISKDENEPYLIDCNYSLEDCCFEISLSDEDKEKLCIGKYIYKIIIITADDKVVTQKSGEIVVKWGA